MRIHLLAALAATAASHVLPELEERQDPGVFHTTVTDHVTTTDFTTATSVIVQTAYVITTGLPCDNNDTGGGNGPSNGGNSNNGPGPGTTQVAAPSSPSTSAVVSPSLATSVNAFTGAPVPPAATGAAGAGEVTTDVTTTVTSPCPEDETNTGQPAQTTTFENFPYISSAAAASAGSGTTAGGSPPLVGAGAPAAAISGSSSAADEFVPNYSAATELPAATDTASADTGDEGGSSDQGVPPAATALGGTQGQETDPQGANNVAPSLIFATGGDDTDTSAPTATTGQQAATSAGDLTGILITPGADADVAPSIMPFPEETPLEEEAPSVFATAPLPSSVFVGAPTLGSDADQAAATLATASWTGPSGPVATLQPALSSDHNGTDYSHLDPTIQNALFFTETGTTDPTISQLFASINVNSTYPSLILEHSDFINNVTCVNGGLQVLFATTDALQHAESVWNGTFVVVTSTVGCTVAPAGQHTYWLVNSTSFPDGTSSAILTAQEIAVENALDDVDVVWGTLNPTNTTTGSPTSTSSASSSASVSSCGQPPSSTISGFPAAACGPNFDKTLDDLLGYYNFSDASFSSSAKDFAPGLQNTSVADFQPNDVVYTNMTALRRRALEHHLQRRWSFTSFIQQAASSVKNAVTSAASTVASVASKAATAVVDAAKSGAQFVADQVSKLTQGNIDTQFNINIGPPASSLVDSKYWGQALRLFHADKSNKASTLSGSVDLYCVKCGITGNAHVSGAIGFSITSLSLNKGNIALDGSLTAGLNLGLAAEVTYQQTFEKTIAEAGVPGFTIPNILTVGPVVSLDAKLDVNINAQGQLLVGATATLPAYHLAVDVVAGTAQQSGWQPQFQTTFSAQGSITADVRMGLPLSVGVGISIPPISWKKVLAVVDEPYIQGTATYAYSTSNPGTCNNGVKYDLSVGDELTVDLFGIKEIPVFDYSHSLAEGCVKFGNRRRSLVHRQTVPVPVAASATNNFGGDGLLNSTELDALALNQVAAQASNANTTNADGITYTTLADSTHNWHLEGDPTDGTLNLVAINATSAGVTFGSLAGVVASDDANRVFHYYPDQMAALGVSRFLLSSPSAIPVGADFISLLAVDTDGRSDTPGVLLAVDSKGNSYYTVACNIDGVGNKVFLASDVNKGPTALLKKDFWWIVAGGITSKCAPVAFLSGVSSGAV